LETYVTALDGKTMSGLARRLRSRVGGVVVEWFGGVG
jgi:hypothetical protein